MSTFPNTLPDSRRIIVLAHTVLVVSALVLFGGRARAADGSAPKAFNLLTPEDGSEVENRVDPMAGPALQWESSSDPQSGIDHYEVWMDGEKVAEVPREMYTAYPQDYGEHTWRVVAVNGAGLKRTSKQHTFMARTRAVCKGQKPARRFLNGPVSSSIQGAVDQANAGDTLLIYPGVYRESVTVDVPGLTIKAAQFSEDTRPDEPETIDAQGKNVALSITARKVTIHGLSVKNTSGTGIRVAADGAVITKNHVRGSKKENGVRITNSKHVSVHRNRLYEFNRGITVSGTSSDVEIRDNRIHQGRTGLHIQGEVSHLTAKHNDLEQNQYGIRVSGKNGALPSDITAHYNDLRKNGASGLQVNGATSSALADHQVDARHNWWGNKDGPSGQGPGTGTGVSGGVQFDPWLKQYWQPTWDSLARDTIPEWFKDSKFGVYMHWTPTTVPAYGSYYSNSMYGGDRANKIEWHTEQYGPPSSFGFKDLIPLFKLEHWNPDTWAALFQESGVRFAGITSEHVDGYAMWDSALTQWDAADMGPRRDVVGELAQAVRDRGMRLILSNHRVYRAEDENWTPRKEGWDTANPKYWGLYMPHLASGQRSEEWIQDWKERLIEKINKYQPSLMWMESGWEEGGRSAVKDDTYFKPEKRRIVAEYYNKALEWGVKPVVTYKWEHRFEYGVWNYEYNLEQVDDVREEPWLADLPINGWFYHRNTSRDDYKSTDRILSTLIDIVSKNGILQVNISPKADGTIPSAIRTRLRELGRWLEVNGEAIYETRPCKTYHDGKQLRFTRNKSGDVLYVISLSWPDSQLTVEKLGSGSELLSREIEQVRLLGSEKQLDWSRTEQALRVGLPDEQPCNYAYAFKVTLKPN